MVECLEKFEFIHFFFSSRRRHTRWNCDWSSDVCSSDLYRRTSADSKGKFSFRGIAPGSYRLVTMESVNLDSEINTPDFARTIGNRGQGLIVDESGKYTVSLRLDVP